MLVLPFDHPKSLSLPSTEDISAHNAYVLNDKLDSQYQKHSSAWAKVTLRAIAIVPTLHF